jgi:membrane protein
LSHFAAPRVIVTPGRCVIASPPVCVTERGGEGGAGGTRRRRRRAASALLRATAYARRSVLPPPVERARHPWTLRLTVAFRFARGFQRRVLEDRVPQRASALAFSTLLSVVPILAVMFAVLSRFGGTDGALNLVHTLAERYFPRATDEATEVLLGLVTRSEIATAGLVGILFTLPVMTSIVREAETALTDIFRVPPLPTVSWRFLAHAGLTLGAPVLAVVGARYLPHFAAGGALRVIDTHLLPLLGSAGILVLLYRHLPSAGVPWRWALLGAFTAALLLEAGKLGFSLYVTHLGRGMHLVWGAVAFVPILLVWLWVTWVFVLLGAEVAAAAHELDVRLDGQRGGGGEDGRPTLRARSPMWGVRQRLRRKVALRAARAAARAEEV